MKIGTLVIFDNVDTLEAKFQKLVDCGFDNCQLNCWKPELFTDENADFINGLCEKYGIKISAFWCGWEGPCVWDFYEGQITIGLVPLEFRQTRIKNLCDGADFAKKLGVVDVATHMGYIPENPLDENFNTFCIAVRTVAQHLKKNGQYLLFETGQETPVTMMRCFEKVGTDNLGVNLDTANLILYGKANPVDALDVFGKYVRNLHAKDGKYPTDGKNLGAETKIGEGKVDFYGVIKGLHDVNYGGYITIEREIEGDQQIKDIMESKEYLQNIINEVYGG